MSQVIDVAKCARVAAAALAPLPRKDKDAALLAMADALVAGADRILAANAQDVESGRAAGWSCARSACHSASSGSSGSSTRSRPSRTCTPVVGRIAFAISWLVYAVTVVLAGRKVLGVPDGCGDVNGLLVATQARVQRAQSCQRVPEPSRRSSATLSVRGSP